MEDSYLVLTCTPTASCLSISVQLFKILQEHGAKFRRTPRLELTVIDQITKRVEKQRSPWNVKRQQPQRQHKTSPMKNLLPSDQIGYVSQAESVSANCANGRKTVYNTLVRRHSTALIKFSAIRLAGTRMPLRVA
jgi:hypothetical protein